MAYDAVIGLEIHVQLRCQTKLFCDCPNRPGDEPNRNTCPVCLGFPGALPRLSREAVEKAILLALGLHCEVQPRSAFDQKVYYYPDLPKGFQLSQAHLPLARNGWIDIRDDGGAPKRIRIRKIHMEEDVARLVHETENRTPVSLVDFNRAGVPLVEIVTEPDVRTPGEAMAFVRALRTRIRYTGCSDCNMEQGTLRVDANISLRPRGADVLNTKVEVKNMNSIRHVGDAAAYEIQRQTACLQAGEAIVLHTRLWDPDKGVTTAMRGKFEGPCVPDPTVPPIAVTADWLGEIRARLPEMPDERAARFQEAFALTEEEAALLSAERDEADYFEAVVREGVQPRTAFRWISAQVAPLLRERREGFAEAAVTPARLASLLRLLDQDAIHANAAREILGQVFAGGGDVDALVARQGLRQVSDRDVLAGMVEQVLSSHPAAVADYRAGTGKALGFLIGQAMQASGGKANPKTLRELLLAKLA